VLPSEVQKSLEPAVHASVATGFGAALAIGAIAATISGILTWLLIRTGDTRATVPEADRA
jgi:hypothetical protein